MPIREKICCLAVAVTTMSSGIAPAQISDKARAVHRAAIVIDSHADTPMRFVDENFDIGSADPGDTGYISLDKARAGNLGAEFFSIFVAPRFRGGFARRAFDLIDSVYQQAARHPDRMRMAFRAADIARARKEGKLAALMGIEGGHAIENDIRILRTFYRLGARYMTLTWANTNEWADSSGDENDPNVPHHGGLTEFGKQVVREMNRLGMMVDISHVSDKTFYDSLAVSKAPIIASHSGCRALTNHARNLTDDMLRAIAKNGGVVQVNFYSGFIDENYRRAEEAQRKARAEAVARYAAARKAQGETVTAAEEERIETEWMARIRRPPLSSLIDHIDHVAKVAGVDHAGLGSDFDGISSSPEGIDSAADLPKITGALLARGYPAADVRKILGGNLLRVFREVERVGAEMRAKQRE